jgi:hypothetical protein
VWWCVLVVWRGRPARELVTNWDTTPEPAYSAVKSKRGSCENSSLAARGQ